MAKYLLKAKYTQGGVAGLRGEGGTKRRDALENTIKGVGGSLESFYYAFGDTDLFMIADLPDNETASAVSLVINEAGVLELSVTPLLTVDEIDSAAAKSVPYRPPAS